MPRDFLSLPATSIFVFEHSAALCSAASLLGGDVAEKRVQRLVDEVNLGSTMTRWLHRELDMLEDLLALRHVHDPERIEAECFAAIDPASAVVEEICLLLDGMRRARREARPAAA